MGAFRDYKAAKSKGFLLDEERIRKIKQIITTRTQELDEECKPVYKVYRADGLTYTTQDVQEVLSEENAVRNKIAALTISADAGDDFSLELDFSMESTTFHIEGEDKDTVFLLSSELRTYLSNEVDIIRPVRKAVERIIFAVGALLAIGGFGWTFARILRSTDIPSEAALESQDVLEKLNYLIESKAQTSQAGASNALVAMLLGLTTGFILIVCSEPIAKPIERLYPSSIFLLGKEIERYEKRQRLRERLIWVVIAGFVISILSGLILLPFTK